jgi:hypothetical protein
MFVLRKRVSSGHWDDVREERWLDILVLLQQVQKELAENGKRRAQAQMDKILWQRRERKGLRGFHAQLSPLYQLFVGK